MHKHLAVLAFAASLAVAQQPYGLPTQGSNGFMPRLSAPGAWIGNGNFGFDVQCGLGGSPAFVVIATAPGNQPLFGVEALLDPATVLGSLLTVLSGSLPGEGQGFAPLPLILPPNPSLVGAAFFAQALIPDPGSPGGVFAATNAVRLELSLPPQIFVACSIASNDPFQVVDPVTNTIVDTGSPAQVDNVRGAGFADGGKRLLVASGFGSIGVADVETLPATWTTIFTSSTCHGIEVDAQRGWVWTLTDPGTLTGGTRELTAIDIDESAPTFGQVVANTVGVAGSFTERWGMSATRRRAAVLSLLPASLTIVDTDSASTTFLQSLYSTVLIPANQPTTILLANQVRITPDDRYALVLLQFPGATPAEIARFDIDAGVWVDHNPSLASLQNIGPFSSPPVTFGGAPHGFAMSQTGRFAIVSGFNGCGWAGRLTLDPKDPQQFSWTPFSPGVDLANAWAAGLSGDETEVAIATWPSQQCAAVTSPALHRLDAQTGALLGTTPIPFNSNPPQLQNLYTVVYR